MSVIFSENSGLNDSFWALDAKALEAIINDADSEKGRYDDFVDTVFNVRSSKRYAEKTTGLSSLGDMVITKEGDAAPIEDIQEVDPKLIIHNQFMGGFECTRQMKDDGEIDVMKTAAQNMVRSYKRTRAKLASAALVTEGANYTFSGKTLDKTTGDGLALFNTAHKGKDGVPTQSNVFTDAFGTNADMLVELANIGRNFRNASGEVQGYTFDTIIIPSNCYQLEETIKKIIRTELIVGSDHNDVNTQKGLWKLVINPCWQVSSGAPYILMSSEANKELLAAMFYDRTPLDVTSEVIKKTRNLEWTSYARMSAGFRDWRAFIMGGAASGTTLHA